MRWIEKLETMESSLEHSVERNGVKNIKEENSKIETKQDLYEKIEMTIDTYQTLRELQEIGEDVSTAIEVCNSKLRELLNIGRESSLISEAEENEIVQRVAKMLEASEADKWLKRFENFEAAKLPNATFLKADIIEEMKQTQNEQQHTKESKHDREM